MQHEPPPPGSPLESIIILLWQMRRDIEYQAHRVAVQAAVDANDDGKSVQEAWKAYADAFYPYTKGHRERSDAAGLDLLKREVAKGGLRVRPVQPLVKSKMNSKRINQISERVK